MDLDDCDKDAMTVAQLIEALSELPSQARVGMLWDGSLRSNVECVWLSRSGWVGVGPKDEPIYDEGYRVMDAVGIDAKPYLTAGEMLR